MKYNRFKCVFAISDEVSERIKRISKKTLLFKGEILEKLIEEQDVNQPIKYKGTASSENLLKVNWYVSQHAYDKLQILADKNEMSKYKICQSLVNSLIDAKVEIMVEYEESF